MGVSQSKKKSSSSTKDMKLYSKRHLTTNSTSTTSSQPQSVSTKSNHGKHINNNSNNSSSSNDSSNKIQPSVLHIHNNNDTSRPTTPIITNSSMNNQSSIINRFSAINSSPSIVSSPSTSEKQHIHSHQSNSFFLPKDWESKNYDYNVSFLLSYISLLTAILASLCFKDYFWRKRYTGCGTKTTKRCSYCSNGLMYWAMDDDCRFFGIEIIPNSFLQDFPPLPNVTFERGLPYNEIFEKFKDNSVDYVHLRTCSGYLDVTRWTLLIQDIFRVLKPGGVIRVEDIHNQPSGTVMIESFIETIRNISAANNFDFDIIAKMGTILTQQNFQVIETKKKTIHYGSGGRLAEEFLLFILNSFEQAGDQLGPMLGLDIEDYKHRVEMFCAQCVKNDASMDWYSYVARKP
ncbi:hypothetical protein RMCBS344292_10005 [Rhizopus microsporus]|nr:hypothetical protein RMCBS344292_10005 [Rhizopus microsporus]